MRENGFFSISEFAKLSRTTRDTLLHYDKIGLLQPLSRGANNYRRYSNNQLALVNVIRTLQELGMSLDEIKALMDRRTPGRTDELFSRQIEKINFRIENWIQARNLLLTLQKIINSVSGVDENAVTIQFLPADAIMIGGLNDYSHGRSDYDALLSFYEYVAVKRPDINMNYPAWAIFSAERLIRRDWHWPDRYYLYCPDGDDIRPPALYAIGYARGGYGRNDGLFSRLVNFIDRNGFEINGDAYVEYPLNEVCIVDDNNYLARIMICVREKPGSAAPAQLRSALC